MWLRRMVGSVLALSGAVALALLGPALYGPVQGGLRLVVRIGIPGVLLICLAAGFALAGGLALVFGRRSGEPRVKNTPGGVHRFSGFDFH